VNCFCLCFMFYVCFYVYVCFFFFTCVVKPEIVFLAPWRVLDCKFNCDLAFSACLYLFMFIHVCWCLFVNFLLFMFVSLLFYPKTSSAIDAEEWIELLSLTKLSIFIFLSGKGSNFFDLNKEDLSHVSYVIR